MIIYKNAKLNLHKENEHEQKEMEKDQASPNVIT